MMILAIAAREVRSLFLSPLAWAVLAVVQFILCFFFLVLVESFMVEIQPRLAAVQGAPGFTTWIVARLFDTAAFVLLLIVPLLTMRLISEERRNQTLSLLFSAPVSMTEIVLGKYLGIMTFLMVIPAMLTLMPLSLLVGGSLDLTLLASGLLGLVLMLASFAAVGLFMSSLTAQPIIAAISTIGLLLLLWILDWAGGSSRADEMSGLFAYLSILRHFESLLRGAFSSSDLAYYILFIATFIVMSIRRLDAYRLQH